MLKASRRTWPRTNPDDPGENLTQVPKALPENIGVSLSGGGYRASLFALGGLTAVYDGGMWDAISWIASVSGGSFTNSALATMLSANPSNADFNLAIHRIANTVTKFGSLVGWPRKVRHRGLVGAIYEAGITRSWLQGIDVSLEAIQRPGRLHAFLATDLATLQPTYVTDWMIHAPGLPSEPHVLYRPGHLPVARAVRASATFPGLPCVRVQEADLGSSVLDPMANDLFLGDGGTWNNLGTNWEDEARWLNRSLVPLPGSLPLEVDLHLVMDASTPVRRPRNYRTGRNPISLDRPLMSVFRAFHAAFRSASQAHRVALRPLGSLTDSRVALLGLSSIPHDVDPRGVITKGASRADWCAIVESNESIGTAFRTAIGIKDDDVIHLLAHGYGVVASELGRRSVPYSRFQIPHDRFAFLLG